MKTKKTVLGVLLLYGISLQAQKEVNWTCGEPVHGVVENIHFQGCYEDILITVLEKEKETIVGGIIETTKKIIIKPQKGGKIRIIASNKHAHTGKEDHSHRGLSHRGTKVGSGQGNGESGEKVSRNASLVEKIEPSIELFPNPVNDELTIKTKEKVTYYKITDSFGFIHLEGDHIHNHTIKTNRLTKGIYHLIIQTENQIITKTFYKN